MDEIRWGRFALNRQQRAFLRDGQPVRVQPLTFQLLELLALRPDTALSREEISAALWPGVRVVDDALTQVVRRARAALGDDPLSPAHLLTVPRYGYRLALTAPAPARHAAADPEPGPIRQAAGLAAAAALPGERRSALLGRQPELSFLREAAARCVCILGSGGLGKTTLMRAFLEERGGIFVDLTAARREEDLLQALSAALGVSGSPEVEAWAARLGLAMQARAEEQAGRLWLGLDNLEQLEGCGARVEGWLAAAPGARVVLTSRRDPGVAGAEVLQLRGLPEEAAAELFGRRAGRPATERAREVIGALGGWPLAIELVAGRARWMDDAELAGRLDRPLQLLARGGGAGGRQDSARASLQWSWELLSAGAQRALAAISLWCGRLELAGMERMGEGAGFGLDELEELVGLDLVRREEAGAGGAGLRLGEVERAFGREQLAQVPDGAAIRERWRGLVLADPQAETADLLEIARAGAAGREPGAAARALRTLWARLNGQSGMYVLGPVAEELAPQAVGAAQRSAVLLVQMGLARDRDPARCERLARELLEVSEEEEHLSAAHTTLALLLYSKGLAADAEVHADHGLALAPLPTHRVSAAVMLGVIRAARDPAAGLAILLAAEGEAAGQPRLLMMLLVAISRVRGRLGDIAGAEEALRRALAAPGGTARSPMVAGILCNLGSLLEERDPPAAAQAFADAPAIFRAEGDRRGEVTALTGCAEVLIGQEPARALPMLRQALSLAGELRLHVLRERIAGHLERLAREAGDTAGAAGYRLV